MFLTVTLRSSPPSEADVLEQWQEQADRILQLEAMLAERQQSHQAPPDAPQAKQSVPKTSSADTVDAGFVPEPEQVYNRRATVDFNAPEVSSPSRRRMRRPPR